MKTALFLLSSIISINIYAQIPKTSFTEYSIDAKQCSVLEHQQSRIYIPNYSFMLNGKLYDGMVQIYYRQYTDALDIMINHLPMQYVTPHGEGTLESAGMFEIYAMSSSGDTLQFVQGKEITVRLYSTWNQKGMESFYLTDEGWQKNTLFNSSPSAKNIVPDNDNQLWDDDIWNNSWFENDIAISSSPVPINYETIQDRNFKTLNIDKFGMYNFDKLAEEESIPIYADFKVKTSKELLQTTVYVIYKDMNSVYYYTPGNDQPLLILKGQPFSIVSFANDGSIAKVDDSFIENKDFTIYSGKKLIFPMAKISQKIDTKEDLAQIIK